MRQLGIGFRILRPDFVEPTTSLTRPESYARYCAKAKAISCRQRVRAGLIVSADTVVAVGGRILGKPADPTDARRMLRLLSGRTHLVMSGVAVLKLPEGRMLSGVEITRVAFRPLSHSEIESYLTHPEPYDKAGAYAVQGRAGMFVRSISGCYTNIIGLPVPLLLRLLGRTGWRRFTVKSG